MPLKTGKRIFYVLIAASCGLAACSFLPRAVSFEDKTFIRVAVAKNADQISLRIRGSYRIVSAPDGRILKEGKRLPTEEVSVAGNGILFGKTVLAAGKIDIYPQRDGTVFLNDKSYRGFLRFHTVEKGGLTAVNFLAMEDYVKGVLSRETSKRWPMDALKAQAVAVRTYAFYQKNINKKNIFDVTSDIYSQVYGGKSAERYRTNLAVDRTAGEILLYNKDILPAYYHANCGGHTEDANVLWGHDLPPLKGGVCPYADKAPHATWKKNLQLKGISDKLNANGYDIWLIKDIQPLRHNRSGRNETLKIVTRDKKEVFIKAKDFRDILGPNVIKSTKFDVVMKGYYADFLGQGWGHGVGMCQWGAYGMAREKFKYQEILKFYYPGAKIVDNTQRIFEYESVRLEILWL